MFHDTTPFTNTTLLIYTLALSSFLSLVGTNPQNVVEKIVRSKIYQNTYWKEQCFGLTAETLVDKAMLWQLAATDFKNNVLLPPSAFNTTFICVFPDYE
ncbi:hypothetical protein Q3G72_021902 [Acer saccharum]|nr:hypothetical protein Q3G72_021902 [Acer saccharum]